MMTDITDHEGPNPLARPPLPKRFYKAVGLGADGDLHVVQLDGRTARTPGRSPLGVAERSIAEALAAEWDAQAEHIDPATMPLTRIVNSAIDGVAAKMAETRADIVAYAGNDLLCYRADSPEELVRRQAELWDPLLDWADRSLGARLLTGEGIIPISQPEAAVARFAEALQPFDPLRLTALHVATSLTGSAVIPLALAHREIEGNAAWDAAHVDEDWQARQWGEVDEAGARRRARRRDFDAVVAILRAG